MRLTILKKKSYYALGLALAVIGAILLFLVIWRWWDTDVFSSSDVVSAISSSFDGEDAVLGLGLGLSLMYYFVVGFILLIVGVVVLVLRREKVTVTEETAILLSCPLCKHRWRESMSKSYLQSIGYPNVRTLSRHRCPQCKKFIRPKIVATKKS